MDEGKKSGKITVDGQKSGAIGSKDANACNGQKGYDKEAKPNPVHKD